MCVSEKELLLELSLRNAAYFTPCPASSLTCTVHISILMALRSWASRETCLTWLNPMFMVLIWPWNTVSALHYKITLNPSFSPVTNSPTLMVQDSTLYKMHSLTWKVCQNPEVLKSRLGDAVFTGGLPDCSIVPSMHEQKSSYDPNSGCPSGNGFTCYILTPKPQNSPLKWIWGYWGLGELGPLSEVTWLGDDRTHVQINPELSVGSLC